MFTHKIVHRNVEQLGKLNENPDVRNPVSDGACLHLSYGVRFRGEYLADFLDRHTVAGACVVFLRLVEGREDFKRIILSLRRTVRCAFSDLRRYDDRGNRHGVEKRQPQIFLDRRARKNAPKCANKSYCAVKR